MQYKPEPGISEPNRSVTDSSSIETEVLGYLWARRGQAVERTVMLRDLWGVKQAGATRTLDNHVGRLRKKLEVDPAHPAILLTVHGTGYRLVHGGTES